MLQAPFGDNQYIEVYINKIYKIFLCKCLVRHLVDIWFLLAGVAYIWKNVFFF